MTSQLRLETADPLTPDQVDSIRGILWPVEVTFTRVGVYYLVLCDACGEDVRFDARPASKCSSCGSADVLVEEMVTK